MATLPKWQQPLAVRADRAEKTLTAVMFAAGGGAGAMAAAAAADQDLAELCREVAARTASPLLQQLLTHGARALAANAGVLLAMTVDPDDLVVPAPAVEPDPAVELDEDQALVEEVPGLPVTSGTAETNEVDAEQPQAFAVVDEEGLAVHAAVFPSGPEHWETGLEEVADRVESVRTDVALWKLRNDNNAAYARQSALDAVADIDRCVQVLLTLRSGLVAEMDADSAARADPTEDDEGAP